MGNRKLPILVGAGAVLIALALWQALLAQERGQLRRTIQAEADSIKNKIAADMEVRILSMVRMATRWEIEGEPAGKDWYSNAALLLDRYQGYQVIEWVDPSFRVREIAPPDAMGFDRDAGPAFEQQWRKLLAAAGQRRELLASRLPGPRGGQVFLVCAPILQDQKPDAFLVGMLPVQDWLDNLLADTALGYSIAVLDGAETVYSRAGDDSLRQEWSQQGAFEIHGANWRVRVWPSSELLVAARSPLPKVVLICGLLMALLLSVAVYLAQAARLHENILAVSNQLLKREIGEREQAEDALRRSEANYRSLVQNAPLGIYRIRQGHDSFLTVNHALVEMLGYKSEAELLGLSLARDIYRNPADIRILFEAFQNQERFDDLETEWQRKDGAAITVRLAGRSVTDMPGDVGCYEVIAEDVTEKRALEQQLRQAQKLEAVGRLAGGVAHDFNNMLMVIQGNARMLHSYLGGADSLRRNVEGILKAQDRAASLTRQLLAFSRRQILQPALLDLNALVAETAKLLVPLLGENIELFVTLEPGIGRVKADPRQIEQVIMNLAINARDAMPAGGELAMETRNVSFDEAAARQLHGIHPGDYVLLRVSDTGHGMDAETQAHIFEPFFSTKADSGGTGLGLATAYGVIDQSGGSISVDSELGRGTSFIIYLPRVVEEMEPARHGTPLAASLHGSETVLVVEDEDDVRKITREFLKMWGYTVLEASNGEQAIRLVERPSGPIQLLVTDVVMPGMNGREVAQRLASLLPQMRVLYMSAYTQDAIADFGMLDERTAFIEKPFSPEQLARKVRSVLDQKQPPSLSPDNETEPVSERPKGAGGASAG